jgi:hypothetical protein
MKHNLNVTIFVEEFKDILVTLLNAHFLHIKVALVEIVELLIIVCEIHKLPLAQTCVPSIVPCHAMNVIKSIDNNRLIFANSNESNDKSSSSNNNNLGGRNCVCLKTANGFHYVIDPHV